MADPRFLNPITIFTDIGGIEVDITRKIEEIYTADLATFPIEEGTEITDHVVIKPVQLIVNGGFSDIRITKLLGGSLTSARGRAKTAFDRLLSLFANQEVFDVMDGVHLFENMQFSSLNLTKDNPNYSYSFVAELRAIQIVETGAAFSFSSVDTGDPLQRTRLLASTIVQSGVASTGTLDTFGIVV